MSGFEEAVDRYNDVLQDFMKGRPDGVREMFSDKEDVLLCNPIRPFARGPAEVTETLQKASSLFSEGSCETERIVAFSTPDVGYVVQVESWKAKLGGEEHSGSLRVTMIFRKEESGDWRVSHRQADTVTSARGPEGLFN